MKNKEGFGILFYAFIIFSPLFTGLYFEKDFIWAVVFLTIFSVCACLVNRSIYLGDTKMACVLFLILLLPSCSHLVNTLIFHRTVPITSTIYGTLQILEMQMLYFALLQLKKLNTLYFTSFITKCAIIVSALYLNITLFFPSCYREGRFESTFGYANTLAIYLFFALTLLLNLKNPYPGKPTKWMTFKMASSFFLILGIVLTNSRTVYLITLVYFSYFCYHLLSKQVWRKMASKAILGSVLVLSLMILFIFVKYRDRIELDIMKRDMSLRLSYYKEAVELIRENPQGFGYEEYLRYQVRKEGKYRLRLVHNGLLQMCLNYGILSLILFTLLLYLAIKKAGNTRGELMSYLLVLAHSMVDITFSYISVNNILIITAFLICYDQQKL